MKIAIPTDTMEQAFSNHYDRGYAAGFAEGRKRALEEAAKLCDTYAEDKWALYKGRPPYTGREDGRANQHVEGLSDGAENCAEGIRSLIK